MSRIQHCVTSGREWWVYASSADSLDRLLTAMNLLMVDDLLLHIYMFFCSKHSSRLDPRSFSLKIIKQTIPIIHFPIHHQPPPKQKVATEQPLDAIQNPHHFTTPGHHFIATQVSWLCNFTRSALYLVRALAASSSAKARWVRISWRSRVICTGGVCHPAMGLGKACNTMVKPNKHGEYFEQNPHPHKIRNIYKRLDLIFLKARWVFLGAIFHLHQAWPHSFEESTL